MFFRLSQSLSANCPIRCDIFRKMYYVMNDMKPYPTWPSFRPLKCYNRGNRTTNLIATYIG